MRAPIVGFVLTTLADARDSLRDAALRALDHEPAGLDLWRDPLAPSPLLSTHQAIAASWSRLKNEHTHITKALLALDEAIARHAGWLLTPSRGGIAWREPTERGDIHTLAEAAAIIVSRLARGDARDGAPEAPPRLVVDRDPDFDQRAPDNDDCVPFARAEEG